MHICNGKIREISNPQYILTKMDLVKTFGDDVRPNRAYSLGRCVQETADRSTEVITFKFVFRKWPTLVIWELWFFSFLSQQNALNTFHRFSICECPLFFSFQNLHFRPIVTEWKSFDANMPRLTNAPFKRFFTLSSNEIQWYCLSRMLLLLDVNNKSFQHPTKAFELCTFQQFHSGFDWISSLFCWITNSILELILSRHSSRLLTVFTKWSIL